MWDSGSGGLLFLLPSRRRRDNLSRAAAFTELHCLDGGKNPLFSAEDASLIGFVVELAGLGTADLWTELSARAPRTRLLRDTTAARLYLSSQAEAWAAFAATQLPALDGIEASLTAARKALDAVDKYDSEARERHRQSVRRAERARDELMANTGYVIAGEPAKLTVPAHIRDELFACCCAIQLAQPAARGRSRSRPAPRISSHRAAELETLLATGRAARPDDVDYQDGDEHFWRRHGFPGWRP